MFVVVMVITLLFVVMVTILFFVVITFIFVVMVIFFVVVVVMAFGDREVADLTVCASEVQLLCHLIEGPYQLALPHSTRCSLVSSVAVGVLLPFLPVVMALHLSPHPPSQSCRIDS
jgi:hypothetical protein